jgi:hypothetical protein
VLAWERGEIALPVSTKTNKEFKRYAPGVDQEHPPEGARFYTISSVARFLGLTHKHNRHGLQPNDACLTAFRLIDLIDAGQMRVEQLKGMSRSEANALAEGIERVRDDRLRKAARERDCPERPWFGRSASLLPPCPARC